MTTREEFRGLLEQFADVLDKHDMVEHAPWIDDIMRTWDAQAAEVERLRAEVEALRVGVPLTAENAARARVVECDGGVIERNADFWSSYDMDATTHELIARGATVLAWRRT